jgi:putative heme transporter
VVILVALVTKGFVMALAMAIALFLTVQLEGNLLNPFILGKAVQIHPLGILMAVTAGTIVGGIFGAFIAVPLVAIFNNVATDVLGRSPIPGTALPDGPSP